MFSKTYIVDNIPGSLSNIYEIKILICNTLKSANKPLTKFHLYYVFQLNETVNYFNFCQAIKELLISKHIIEKTNKNDNKKYLYITRLGIETATVLKNDISKYAIEKTNTEMLNLLKRERQNKNRKIFLKSQKDGFSVKLVLEETGTNLLDLGLYCPTKAHAEKIKKEMENKTTDIYGCILAVLNDDSKTIEKILEKIKKIKNS